MLRYMLDTDICSYVMKRSHDALLRRLQKVPVSDVCVSVVTKSELLYGVEVSPRRQQDEAALHAFLNYVEVLDFPENASTHYAQIRAQLKKSREIQGQTEIQGQEIQGNSGTDGTFTNFHPPIRRPEPAFNAGGPGSRPGFGR